MIRLFSGYERLKCKVGLCIDVLGCISLKYRQNNQFIAIQEWCERKSVHSTKESSCKIRGENLEN
jgi:hypothetical protein